MNKDQEKECEVNGHVAAMLILMCDNLIGGILGKSNREQIPSITGVDKGSIQAGSDVMKSYEETLWL